MLFERLINVAAVENDARPPESAKKQKDRRKSNGVAFFAVLLEKPVARATSFTYAPENFFLKSSLKGCS